MMPKRPNNLLLFLPTINPSKKSAGYLATSFIIAVLISYYAFTIIFKIDPNLNLADHSLFIVVTLLALLLTFKLYRVTKEKRKAVLLVDKWQQSYDKVHNTNAVGIWIAELDGNLIQANDALLEMTGYSRTDLENGRMNWKDIIPTEYRQITERAILELQETGICLPFEKQYVRKDGSRITVMLSMSMINKDSDPEIVAYALNTTNAKTAEKHDDIIQEQVFKKQEEMLRIFMDAPASVLITRGPDLKIDFVNHAAMSQMGLQQNTIMGVTTADHFARSKTDFNEDTVKEVYLTGKSFKANAFHIRHDMNGTGILEDSWFDIILQPVLDSEGKIDGVASYTFDVSGLVKANMELEASDSRFRFIADAIPHKMWTAGPDGVANYFNKGWFDYTGMSSPEEIKIHIWNIIHPDDLPHAKFLWDNALATGDDIEIEQRFKNKDGIYLWHLTRVCVYKEDDGSVKLIVGTSTNIQALKSAQQELQRSESHFRALADNNALLIWKTDENCNTTYVNDNWRSYTGIRSDQVSLDNWLNNLHPEDRDHSLKQFRNAFDKRLPFETKYRFRDIRSDQYRWMLDIAQPVFDPDFKGYVGSMVNIHEQETAQIAINLLMQKKDEFFSIASHELKTPITSMKGSLQMLEKLCHQEIDAGKAIPLVNMANKQVNKLTNIVNDLLDITKIQKGNIELKKTVFDLEELTKECIQEIKLFGLKHAVILQVNSPVEINADRAKISQVITNFLSNATKYSSADHDITIRIGIEGLLMVFSITDKGIGVPSEKQPFIFDRFFRVHDSSQHYSGLGLGLYISSEIIKQHEGSYGVISEVGNGATFWFKIPVSPAKITHNSVQ